MLADRDTAWGKIRFALIIIVLIIVSIPIALASPIIVIVYSTIQKYKEKISYDKLIKTKESLKKSLEKIEKKKQKDPDNAKEYDKIIIDLEKQIKDIEKEAHKAKVEKRLYRELDLVKNAYNEKTKHSSYIFTVAYNAEENGFIIEYAGINDSEVYKLAENLCWKNNIIEEFGNLDDYDVWKQSFARLIQSSLGDPKYVYPLDAIDDTIILYSKKTKKFLFGDWNDGTVYTLAQLRSFGKKLCKDEKYIEADAELEYYILSKKDTVINESFIEI